MKLIKLTRGKITEVCDADYEWLTSMGSWCCKKGYAARTTRQNGIDRMVLMHRLIMDAPEDVQVDHIDGNKLNNQRNNLRLCTGAENQRNRGVLSNSRSGIKGVSWYPPSRKWQAKIKVDGQQIHLGCFHNWADAAAAYDKAAVEYHGEFAQLNNLDPHSWDMNTFNRLVAATAKRT